MKRAITAVKKYSARVITLPTRVVARFEALPRPAQLLITVGTVIAISLSIDASHGWQVWNQLFHPDISTMAKVRFWSALVYNLLLAMGLPVAFLVWHWRDKNARDQIENGRKDINLKEFQEVQGRAAGLFDQDMPESAREQLQIAALHQLRAFLRGEYGEAFRRPAFELILAGHAEAMDRIGMGDVRRQIEKADNQIDPFDLHIFEMNAREKIDRIMDERINIIQQEYISIFHSGYPLTKRNFEFCNIVGVNLQKFLDFSESRFTFSNLSYSKFDRSIFKRAHFEGARMFESSLFFSDLSYTYLKGADLSYANIQGTLLNGALLEDAMIDGAEFDDKTDFFGVRGKIDSDEINKTHHDLRERGARHVDDQLDTNDRDMPF